jgi:ERCC4-related helicase/intein/homing endonuclease
MNLTPRAYQLAIYNSILQKGNTLVVLPTGLGKTLIALMLIRDKMKEGKCLFMTPTKPLAKQHHVSVIKTLGISEDSAILVSGEVAQKKRADAYSGADVIISTPQTIRNDIDKGLLDPKKVSLAVFDECVHGDTLIESNQGQRLKIRDIVHKKLNLRVKAFDTNRKVFVFKNVIGFHKIPCRKKILVISAGQNSVKCTEDHLFLTRDPQGTSWKSASSLKIGDFVAIGKNNWNLNGAVAPLFSLEEFIHSYDGISDPSKQRFNSTLVKLKDSGLFPLKYGNPQLLILAQIFGYALGDGWLTERRGQPVYLGFCGVEDDLKLIKEDISRLGGSSSRIYFRNTCSTILSKNGKLHVNGLSLSFLCSSAHIVRTLHVLGFPHGNKITQSYAVPTWIKNGPKAIASAFLGGLFSADANMPTPKKNGRYFFAPKLVFYKTTNLRDNGLAYGKQIMALLKRLGISSTLHFRTANKRNDGSKTLRFEITISISTTNLRKFLNTVPFYYSRKKADLAAKISEYLLLKSQELMGRTSHYNVCMSLHALGMSSSVISKKLKISDSTVESWIFCKRKPTNTSIFFPTFSEWSKTKEAQFAFPLDWIKIEKISTRKKPKFVYDLTVEGVHNYLANGIIVHNCHKAVGNYAYTAVAEAIGKNGKSLVVGLTASPGGKRERINEVLGALFISNVEIRTQNDPDVEPYVQKTNIRWIHTSLTPTFKLIKFELDQMISAHAYKLGSMGFPPPLKSKGQFMKMRERILNMRSGVKYAAIVQYSILLNLLHMLELVETQGLFALNQYLAKIEEKDSKSAKALRNEAGFAHIKEAAQSDEEHPKLKLLVDLLTGEMKGKKAIVFAQYRDQIKRIVEELTKNSIVAKQFVGKKDGVTKKIQEETIAEFREGKFLVMVASSIGEEGLDIPAVDSVIFYEPIPSEIRSIQRRGRAGRFKEGEIIILVTRGTRDEYYHWSSVHREKKMKEIVGGIQRKMEARNNTAKNEKNEKCEERPRPSEGQSKISDF